MTERAYQDLPEKCPVCKSGKRSQSGVIALMVVVYMCGFKVTKTAHDDAIWRVRTECPEAHGLLLEMRAALTEIVTQLRLCDYHCQGGPLEGNVEFIWLIKLAESETP